MKLRLLSLLFAVFLCQVALAQQVRGTVTGRADGEPLPGVTIQVKGTTTGTITGADGTYTVNAGPNNTLIFSFVGYEKTEVPINGQSVVDVGMSDGGAVLGEFVVTALGQTRSQRAVGYATSTIKAEDLTNTGTPNFATALYGKAPGVRIAATPGGATSAVNINIRGINSITGRSQPLMILDGVPIRDGEVRNNDYWSDQRLRGNGLLDINPEDIEDITILKGASAAALYGSEAVNGVVMITTKSGKGRKGLGVDFSATYGVDNTAYLPRYQNVRGPGAPLHVANSGQDAEGFVYYDTDGNGSKETRGVGGFTINFGPRFDGKPTMTWDGVIRPYEAQQNNYGGLFQQGQTSNVNVAISQSTDNSNLRFSLTRQDNKGLSVGSNNIKNIANLNTSFRLGKKWSTDLLINFVNQTTENRPLSIDRMINNFGGMMGRFEHADWYLNKIETSQGYRYARGTEQSLTPNENIIYNGFKNDLADYVWRLKKHNVIENSNRVIASMTHHYQIVENLRFRGRLSTDFTSERIESKFATERPLSFGPSGSFGLESNQYSIVYGDALLTYTKKINEDLEVSLMGGYTASTELVTRLSRSTNGGLSTENLFDIAASFNLANSNSSRRALVKDAVLGTVNLSYRDFMFLEGTIRRDRTSTMAPDNNAFVYPSFNASLIFSEALRLPEFVSYGKLRASWGIVGNYPDLYLANIAYNQGTLGVQAVGGQPVLFTNIPSSFGNDFIRPEQKHEYEFGLETKFFKNRLSLDVSYYNAQIRDQILPLTLPVTSGAGSVLTNVGTLRNQGIEVALGAKIVQGKLISWEMGVNFSSNKNVVEKLANNATELLHADFDGNAAQLRSVVGQPMGDFYVPPVLKHSNGQDIISANGLYQLDSRTWKKAGNTMPKAVGGIWSSVGVKGFTLDVLADFRLGGYVMPTGINWMISRGLLEESTKFMDKESGGLSYYVSGGKGVQTTADKGPNGEQVFHDGMLLPGVTVEGAPNTNVVSQAYYYWLTYNWGGPQYGSARYENYIVKNSYVKLREVSLSYRVPQNIGKKLGMRNLQVSVFGRNLLYFYRTIKDIDAEQLTAGSRWDQTVTNAGTNPSSRSMGVMLRASF
jgi:iron complex outermembrane recepter protein